MTMITPVERNGATDDLVSEAIQLYSLASQALSQVIDELRTAGDEKSVKELCSYTKEHRAALQLVLNERANVEKLRKLESGIVHDYALDFDAARDEIGRRLARLRDAGSGG